MKRTNNSLRKLCGCPKRQWSRCLHPWHFAFQWKGTHHRYSLDRLLGRKLTSKTEADAAAEQLRIDIRAGRDPRTVTSTSHGVTVRQLLDAYEKAVIAPRGDTATRNHGAKVAVVTKTLVPAVTGALVAFGDWRVREVTTDALERFRDARAVTGRVGANRSMGTLSAAFSWGASLRRGFVSDNPFKDGNRPALQKFEEQARTRRLRAGERERLLAACGDHLRAVVECALETGMRRGEILSLQWSQVRLSPNAQIVLPAWKTKTRRDRTIPISARLRAILEMRRIGPDGKERPGGAYVFGNEVGGRVLSFKRAWQTAVLKAHGHKATYVSGANLSPVSRAMLREIDLHFHDLRREAGSRWLDGGAPLHVVQSWLGHTNVAQTSSYLAVRDDGGADAMARLDALRGDEPARVGRSAVDS